jgi:DNA-binding response OmpR family regulator
VKKRILVVEDDQDLIELLCFNLKKAGFAIGTAVDGIEGLKKARSLVPDLILLDVMLPEMNGFAVCETLRRDPQTASIPIIMLTAMSSQIARLTGLDAGASDFLTKPFQTKDLVARIRTRLLMTDGCPS